MTVGKFRCHPSLTGLEPAWYGERRLTINPQKGAIHPAGEHYQAQRRSTPPGLNQSLSPLPEIALSSYPMALHAPPRQSREAP